jgi:regulator of protease activity HflC (stomatin/prohibitin superfamily)
MHRVMVAMLLETQRELTELRARADADADAILAQAERDSAMILAGTTPTPGPSAVAASDAKPIAAVPASLPEIDLGGADPAPANGSTAIDESAAQEAGGDEYFDFLRGALADESPLGPGTE